MKQIIYLIIISSIFSSCKTQHTEENRPVAKVIDKYLFINEIKDIVPNNSSKEDSILIANSYINQWITKQLLLQKAELNLNSDEKDISRLVEDYRSSILTHRYKEKLMEQKLNLNFSQEQLKTYYDKYKSNFTLSHNIVKALFIKIPNNAPGLDRIKKIYKSSKVSHSEELENYCILNASKYDNFNEEWIPASKLLLNLPIEYDNEEKYLKNNFYIEVKDREYVYFVKINDTRYINMQAPFYYVIDDLEQIVKNKKRIEFESQLEKEIHEDAKEKKLYTIY
jgi:hypothetical protein